MTIAQVAGARVVLCADDYGISPGVSRGIRELIEIRRLSATGAMVTFPEWPGAAQAVLPLRDRAAVGLHLNLTLGKPLTAMPTVAPAGSFPSVGELIRKVMRTFSGRAGIIAEVRQETEAQLAAFEDALGYPPDFVDGHQHVHALPVIRDGVLEAISRRKDHSDMLVRDPADRWRSIKARGGATGKAAAIALLARGFRKSAQTIGLPTNEGFAGFSSFDRASAYTDELEAFFRAPGQRHLVMCHPGYADDILVSRDPVTLRREDELRALRQDGKVSSRIVVINRPTPAERIDWHRLWEAEAP